jgi:class 3 adenylate cyclase
MVEARVERRLAAILAADVAGYSRLMGVDEERTLAALKGCRRELIDPKIAEHRGRIVNTTGDGVLVEFASVVDAVRCATEIQRAMAERNAAIPEDRRIEFRIGINVGDIIIDDGDIYGDGVNIAARVEALAKPGAICISDNAYQQVKGKFALEVSDMGEQQLKNIAELIRAYQLQLEGLANVWAERYDRDLIDIFSLQDEITERVAGAIEPELLKIEAGRAATRSATSLSAWDLVCQGTWHFHQVTPAGHKRAQELFREAIKINSRLPDAHIWLARVSAGIVAFGWSENPQNDLREGLQAAHVAIRLDEKDPYSHYALAIISVFSDALEQAVRAGEKAVEISPSFTLGHFVLGLGRLFSGNAIDSIDSFERGLRLNPYDPQNFVFIQMLALAYYFAGQNEKALHTAIRASEIRPTWLPTLETLAVC